MPKPKRVLVVDDHEAILDSVAMFVMCVGHVAESVAGGAEALEKLERSEFDVVLTDLLMPDMNGEQLAQEIKKRQPDLPVVLMTGRPPEEFSPEIARTLRKPFSLAELRTAIGEVC